VNVDIKDAQRDVRTAYLGGFAGQLVSGAVWSVSAAFATWDSARAAIWVLVVGGFFIFPLTQLLLRLMGRPVALPKGHPMNALAIQIAFTVPFSLPLVAAATLHRQNWFYPAFMIVVGAHYLPFIFLYGMPEFGVLAGLLIAGGWLIGMYLPSTFVPGGWFTAGALLVFAFVGRRVAMRNDK
jgi:hypothetical protein